jgi:hypothetical protein
LFKSDAEMNFAAFKQGFLLGTERFTQLYMYVGKALSILRQKSGEHAHFAIETQISTAMGPAAKTPHTLVHTDLAKFGAHAHLDKDRAVNRAGGGQALDLRCRTFNLLPPDCSRLRVPVGRSMVHPHCRSRLRITPSQKSRSSILWPARGDPLPAPAMPVSVMRSFAVAISTAENMLAPTCKAT